LEKIQNAKLITHPGGHALLWEQPRLYNDWLEDFACTIAG
jgi:hypothetical protein